MSIYELIFGKHAPDSAVQGPPAYDNPLRHRDFSAALPLLRAAIAQEDARAMGAYGALCATGLGIEKNLHEAYCWFLQSAHRGDVPAQVALGMLLAGGLGTPINRTEAAYWLYRASLAGNQRAIKILEALTEKDHSVIGPHFTAEELYRLLYSATAIRVATRVSPPKQRRN